jgi:hypothetical protein
MYRTWQYFNGPPWLQGNNSGKFEQEFGGVKDSFLDRARLGVLARMPGAATREVPPIQSGDPTPVAPTDALDLIGADRLRRRAPSETDSAYAPRLITAWEDFALLGGPLGLLTELATLGYTGANIIQDNGRYWYLTGATLTSGTLMTMINRGRAGWMFDTRDDLWSRFALLFTADASNLSDVAGQAILNSTVQQWRPHVSTFIGTFVILAGRVWGWPTTSHTWGSGNWGGNSCRFIPPDGNPAVNI